MSHHYTVELTVGDHQWTIDRGDQPDDIPATGLVLDGLTCGWRFGNDPLYPSQPEPETCRFGLLFPAATDAAGIDIDTPVHLRVYLGLVDDLDQPIESVRFAGRVSDRTGKPRTFNAQLVWQLDLVATGYTADLAQYDVAGTMPQQGLSVLGKVVGLFDLAGLPAPDWSDGGYGATQLTLDEGRIDSTTLAAAVDRYLATYADASYLTGPEADRNNHAAYAEQGWRRGVVRAQLTADGLPDPVEPWRIEWVTKRSLATETATPYPARLSQLTPPPPT